MKAVILAGGYGKRLRPLTMDRPKPLIEIAGKPILLWQIEWLKKYGIDEIVLLVGYLRDKIIEYIGSGRKFNVKVTYVVEDEPLGTGGALKNAELVLRNEEKFLVLNGDIITNLDPLRLLANVNENIVVSIAAVPLRSPYGILSIDEKGYITRFEEKPIIENYWINAGVYAMTPKIFRYLPNRGDIERTTFPKLAFEKRLTATKYTEVFWRSIDTYKDVEEAGKELSTLKGA